MPQYEFSASAIIQKASLLAMLCLMLPPLALCAVIPDGTYLVQMADSDHMVFFTTAESPPRVLLKEYTQSGFWTFQHLGDDYYKVTEQSHYWVLDSCRGEKYNGVPIIIFPWHGGKNQRWKVIRRGNFYSLVNQKTGLALDLKNNKMKAGGVFQGYTANTSRGQLFRLTPQKPTTPREQPSKPAENQIKSFSNGPAAQ